MEDMLRRALRESLGLRHQLEKNLLGEKGDVWGAEFKKFLRKETCWAPEIAALPAPTDLLKRWHDGWPKFWKRFGFNLTDNDLILPAYRPGFNWSIVDPPGLTNNRAFEICQELFRCWKYWDDLDVIKPANELGQKIEQARVVLVRDTVEPDEEWRDHSANMIWEKRIPVLTVRKRLILEARYSLETKNHLDLVGWTNCAASVAPHGAVPGADWGPGYGEFQVCWDGADGRGARSGPREAVF